MNGDVVSNAFAAEPRTRQTLSLNVQPIFALPFVKRFALCYCYRTVCLSVCLRRWCSLLWPNGWTDQDETWHAGTPRPWPHCVRWGPSRPPQTYPIFGPFLLWPNGWMHQDATWYGCRPQPRGLCVRWRPPKNFFSAQVYCGQTARWIKMPLGTKVGLSPGDSVLDGDPAPPHKGGGAPYPIYGPFLLWPNGWMHQDATWYGGRPQSRRLWVRWGPSPPPKREAEAGGRAPPQFSAHGYCG